MESVNKMHLLIKTIIMKPFTFTLLILVMICKTSAQDNIEKETNSVIKKVTVYTQGAQIEREAIVSLQKGKMILKFTGLSPFINKESIRVGGDGSFVILNVQHQNDYLNQLDKNKEIELLKSKIEELQEKIEEEETWVSIIKERLGFLNANKEIVSKEQGINPETYKTLSTIYGDDIESLNMELLRKKRSITGYQRELDKINNQVSSLNGRSELPSGTIIITIDSKQIKSTQLKFSYIVDNASWYPSYDIRFLGVNKPLSVNYKANIKQLTGVDWKDVSLVLSNAPINLSAQIPEFNPFYLQYYYPEIARALQGKAAGVQITNNADMQGSPSEIRVRGLGSVKSNYEPLYVVDGIPQDNLLSLNPNDIDRIEVLKDASSTAIYGSRGANGVVLVTTKQNKEESSVPLTIISKRETSNEYMVEAPQTIYSNDKIASVNYNEVELNAVYTYQAIPRSSENVFLIGRIPDWYKADFMDGDANVYLENSYVGMSTINTQQFTDTLEISFGIDNNISIKHEKVKEYTENQLIGSNRKETIGYKITVRNNKTYSITTKIIDQIPISTIKDIQVEPVEISGGTLDIESGKVVWNLKLDANETKELSIKYSVKYPKDKKVLIN